MFKLFNNFKGFTIFEYFLKNPNKSVGIRELAKILKISPSTTKHYIDQFIKEELLIDQNAKHSKQTILNNNNNLIVKEMKKIYVLDKVKELELEKEINNSFYIFGSCASGTYNENSDIDIFVIKQRPYNKEKVESLANKIRSEVNIKEVPFYKLDEYIKNNKVFIDEVKRGIYFGDPLHGL